jgi:hypothetical protein
MPRLTQLWKHTIQQFKLASCSIQHVIRPPAWIHGIFDAFKDKRMVADLSQLHDRIVQPFDAMFSTKRKDECQVCVVSSSVYPFSSDEV